MFLIFNPHTTPTATPTRTQIYCKTVSYPRCPKAEVAFEPLNHLHWSTEKELVAGGQWQSRLPQQSLHTVCPLSPLTDTQVPHSLASLLLQDKMTSRIPLGILGFPLGACEHTLDVRISSSLACASSCVCLPTSNPSMHPPLMEQTKIVFWVRSGQRLAHKSHPGALSLGISWLQWARGPCLNLSKLQS